MQTFLPSPDFVESARALDDTRLGKQRVEALQIIRALTRPTYGWKHHPATKMWAGYEEALGAYGLVVTEVWCERGRADTCATTIVADLAEAGFDRPRTQAELAASGELPPWLGDEAFHRSHRSSLLRKDPDHYGPLFPGVPDDLEYVWPGRSDDPSSLTSQVTMKGRAQRTVRG